MINAVRKADYLSSVVPSEMPSNWPIEALKAQAVAARTYLAYQLNNPKHKTFDVCASTHCQVYGGVSSETLASVNAVNSTSGVVMTYGGSAINAIYHADSGGHTESTANIWGGSLAYIVAKADPYSVSTPYSNWTVNYSKEEISRRLADRGYEIGKLSEIRIDSRSSSGRVSSMTFMGDAASITMTGNTIRSAFQIKDVDPYGAEIYKEKLKSTFFEISTTTTPFYMMTGSNKWQGPLENRVVKTETETSLLGGGKSYKLLTSKGETSINVDVTNYTINGKGYGHGAGMSQYGAKNMASGGSSYVEILKFYYTGITLENR